MGARVYAHTAEVRIKYVLAMASVGNAVVDNELQDHVKGVLAMERQVLTIAGHDLSVLLQAFLNRGAVMGLVLDETLGTGVDNVVAAGAAKVFAPLKGLNRLQSVQVLDSFVDGCGSFLGAQSGATGLLKQVAFEALQHLLEVGNARAGIVSNLVLYFENLPIHLRDVTRQCKLHFY